ncbi:MAG TPA: glycosyltransferase family 9 protein [Tepidisphaeraceae bacterium]|nr:glycosyltransferase family 9 protein [Tepidisphaeraceae bacterium]
MRRNILIFHLGALGDFIMTWPLALALARLHPQSRVFYVTHGQKGALAERVLRVESMDVETGGWQALFADGPDLPAPAARALAGAHTVLNFLGDPGERWAANVKTLNPEAQVLSISTNAPTDFAGHQTQHLADQLAPWPAAHAAAQQILHSIAQRGLVTPPARAGGPIIIHPGGGSPLKCWPAPSYLDLIARLRAEGRAVRVLLGEVELERWPVELIAKFRAIAEVQTPGNLVDMLAALSGASAFVGNDSGPGHLAGILGVPTLSLFGPASQPDRWKPLGPKARVLRADSLESLTASDVACSTVAAASHLPPPGPAGKG